MSKRLLPRPNGADRPDRQTEQHEHNVPQDTPEQPFNEYVTEAGRVSARPRDPHVQRPPEHRRYDPQPLPRYRPSPPLPVKHKVQYAKAVTISAAFTFDSGVLLCADTQHTLGGVQLES